MKNQKKCLECDQYIAVGVNKCQCGWRVPYTKNVSIENHYCQFHMNGRSCKLLGSMSHATHSNCTWYCSYHYQSIADPKKGAEFLDYIEKNYHDIIDQRIDWRRKLHM